MESIDFIEIKNTIIKKLKDTPLLPFPFPHIYIEDFLPNDLYLEILREYPTCDTFRLHSSKTAIENNTRYQISIKDIYEKGEYTHYRKVIEQIFDQEFYETIRTKFNYGPDTKVGRRFIDDCDVQLDFQPGINSPVTRECSVRHPHVDSPEELFAGLLYLKDPGDDSIGGELELYNIKGKPRFCRKTRINDTDRVYLRKNEITNSDCLTKEKTIPYKANNFVMFVNNKQAIHGVSPRSVTHHERRLLNIVYEKKSSKCKDNDVM